MKEILFTKSDELSKASRKFLEILKEEVAEGEVFFAQQIRKKLRLSPAALKRYLYTLRQHGYIKIKGGSKYRGFEYAITNYTEYVDLESVIDVKLKGILGKIKEKSGSVAH